MTSDCKEDREGIDFNVIVYMYIQRKHKGRERGVCLDSDVIVCTQREAPWFLLCGI